MPNSNNGAIPALRGYRTQFLYTLHRVLNAGASEVVFPEGEEDYSVQNKGQLKEVVQIKNLSSDLQLSDFHPKAADGFIARCLAVLKQNAQVNLQIVSFGGIGPELKAFQEQGKHSVLQTKLESYGYEASAIENLLNSLQIISVQVKDIQAQIDSWLRDSVAGIDTDITCDLLLFWMYQLAEAQQSVNKEQLLEKVNNIAAFISERHRFLTEFGRSILPLAEGTDAKNDLRSQYHSGIAASYAHILANLDVPRPDKMAAIEEAFKEHSLVIVHGASGQGKSTLAYRYLHEYYPAGFVYRIVSLTDLAQVLDIAQAIKALARPIQQAFVVYVDVSPGDQHWVKLCQALGGIAHCRVLVTIREEDLRRSASINEYLDAKQLSLAFTEAEAKVLFTQFQQTVGLPPFLNFQDAWSRFGGEGPLLEFVYLLRQGERLKDRLATQLRRIQDQAALEQDTAQVDLLRYLSVAGAHHCRLDLKQVLGSLSLANPKRTLEYFEEEYLLRRSTDGIHVEALHPVRASLMMELLTDPVISPIEGTLSVIFPLVVEEDVGNFILQYAYDYGWPESMMELLLQRKLQAWYNCRSVLSAMIWCGVQEHINSNAATIKALREQFPQAASLALMLWIGNQRDNTLLERFFPAERLQEMHVLLDAISPAGEFYAFTKAWLATTTLPVDIDITDSVEISGLGYILFWQQHLNIDDPIADIIANRLAELYGQTLPVNASDDLLLGLQLHSEQGRAIAEALLPGFLREYQAEGKIIWLEDDENEVKVHFLSPTKDDESKEGGKDLFNDRAMYLLRILRKVFPFREYYSTKGYGHHFASISLPYDATEKRISAEALHLPWLTDANRIFLNLTSWSERHPNWSLLIDELYLTRNNVEHFVDQLLRGLSLISQRRKLKNSTKILPKFPNPSSTIKLPKEAVDRLGYFGDFASLPKDEKISNVLPDLKMIFPELESSIKKIKDFHSSFRNFTDQAYKALAIKEAIQVWSPKELKARTDELRKLGYALDNLRLSKYNLTQLVEAAPAYLAALNIITEGKAIEKRFDEKIFLQNLQQLQSTWFYFIDHPIRQRNHIIQKGQQWNESLLTDFTTNLNSILLELKVKQGVKDVELIHSTKVNGHWYVLVYIDNWPQALLCQEAIFGILKRAVPFKELSDSSYMLLEQSIKRIWFIPLYGDYLISRHTIGFDIYHLLPENKEPITITNYATKITDGLIQELDIDLVGKDYPGFAVANEFYEQVNAIIISLEHLVQLFPLAGKSNTGDVLLEVQIKTVVIDIVKSARKCITMGNDFVDLVTNELKKPVPYIPDSQMMEYFKPIIIELNAINELPEKTEDDGLDTVLTNEITAIQQRFSVQTEGINMLYWCWLDLLIHIHLKP